MTRVAALAVVVPARDEARLIGRCLESVGRAIEFLHASTGLHASLTVVADGCVDDTAAIARRYPFARVIDTDPIGVGAARHLGTFEALQSDDVAPDTVWLAHTDADSRVRREWLVNQLQVANADAHIRIGAVRPEFSDLTPAQVRAWKLSHRGGAARGHIHGANLGVHASTYLAAGGFRPLALHEDVDFVRVAASNGAVVATAERPDVITSGRSVGRVEGGYASYLSGALLGEPA